MFNRVFTSKMGRYSNFFTLASIIIIIIMFYIASGRIAKEEAVYPEMLYYKSYRYEFLEEIADSPLKYTSRPKISYDGYKLLFLKKSLKENPPKSLYIFIGSKKYRKYVLVN